MSEYTFRLATAEDEGAIRAFMGAHWDGPHPLLSLPDFFEYYYRGQNGALHFGLCLQDSNIAAIAGYIPASKRPRPDIWVSLWVADKAAQGSGLELMEALPRLTGCRSMACNNIRPKTRPFYHFLGMETGRVCHFYRLADKAQYRLARITHKERPPVAGGALLQRFAGGDDLLQSGFVPPKEANPYKDLWYITRRYYGYPRQQYDVYGVMLPGRDVPDGLLCTRTIQAGGTAVLRVADFIGPQALLPQMGKAIEGLMQQAGAEYADCYCVGVPAETMYQAGFAARTEGDENILPNYLDPPLIENTDYYYFTNRPEGFTLFKADGDQDRPNVPLD